MTDTHYACGEVKQCSTLSVTAQTQTKVDWGMHQLHRADEILVKWHVMSLTTAT